MMKTIFAAVCLIITLNCNAQSFSTVFDGNGKEIGQLASQPSAGSPAGVVVTPDSLAVHVNFVTGALIPGVMLYYETNNCTGQAYVLNPSNNIISHLVFGLNIKITPDTPYPILIVDVNAEIHEMQFSSRSSGGTQCTQVNHNAASAAVEFVDPTQYGMIITQNGEWGFTPPLSVKAQKVTLQDEVIFCNGYESCSVQ